MQVSHSREFQQQLIHCITPNEGSFFYRIDTGENYLLKWCYPWAWQRDSNPWVSIRICGYSFKSI